MHHRTGDISVAIVGNDPSMDDSAREIDACDMVVRFNKAVGFGGVAGRRVTHLALVNRGGQPREWIRDGSLASIAALRGACEVIFPFPPLHDGPEGICWTREMIASLTPFGIRPRALGEDVHRAARSTLRRFGAQDHSHPSTGFLVVFDLLRSNRLRGRPIVFGFGFEGWEGHPWAAERAWFEHHHAAGHLDLRPTPG